VTSQNRAPAAPLDRAAERARIMEAAYQLLSDSKGASIPITDVLTAAGMSTRAFYRHFDTKDALLLEMFRSDSERVLRNLRRTASRAENAKEALHVWIGSMLRLAADPRRRSRALVLVSDEVVRAKNYRIERERYLARQDEVLEEILRRGIEDGSIPHVHPGADAPLVRAVVHEAFDMTIRRYPDHDVAALANSVRAFVDRALCIGRSSTC
jgi:AcrR family transcriptional regulator